MPARYILRRLVAGYVDPRDIAVDVEPQQQNAADIHLVGSLARVDGLAASVAGASIADRCLRVVHRRSRESAPPRLFLSFSSTVKVRHDEAPRRPTFGSKATAAPQLLFGTVALGENGRGDRI